MSEFILKKISQLDALTKIWLALIGLTLASALMAETGHFGVLSTLIVCGIIVVKGQLIIDRFIGLKNANQTIRKVMLGYFYLLPLLIAWGVIHPASFRWIP